MRLSHGLVEPVPGRWTQRSCLRVRQPLGSKGHLLPVTGREEVFSLPLSVAPLNASTLGMAISHWCSPWLLLLKRAVTPIIINNHHNNDKV